MRYSLLAILFAVCVSPTALVAQEARPAQVDAAKPTHGIVRKPPAKTQPQPVNQPPVATKQAAATAIAEAVRSFEETTKQESQSPAAARPAERRAPRRRYELRWPSEHLEVEWAVADDRATLAWP